jgi:hypothetical protein
MMQMLQAGGMRVLTDLIRQPDESNPRGYYEFEAVKRTRQTAAWIKEAPGCAVKIIYRLLYDLPPDRSYRVLFMRRDLAQVVASQQAMLGKSSTALAEQQRMMEVFKNEIELVDRWLKTQPQFSVWDVPHRELITSSAVIAAQIRDFLQYPLDVAAMCGVVDPALHRRK